MEANLATVNADIDLDLTERVSQAIGALDILHGTRAHVDVQAVNGHVTLEGIVQSPMSAVEVARAATDVPGVSGVTSHVVDDATLSRKVAEALSKDERTRAIPPGYEVTSVFGHLTVIGRFTEEQARALQAVCQSVRSVRTVKVKRL
jgi:osmotically-inducible protein OsmY